MTDARSSLQQAWSLSCNKLLHLGGPPSSSTTPGGTPAVFSFAICAILLFNCWWFLLLPWQRTDLILISGDGSGFHSSAAANRTATPTLPLVLPTPPGVAIAGLCDVSQGKWIPDASPPLYSDETCRYINRNQNCVRNGRPDLGYLNWRWKPSDCELPPFDATFFLELMRSKHLALIGDSLGRNQMEALTCTLAQVEDPLNLISSSTEREFRWHFASHNFTLTYLRSTFLVNYTVEDDLYKLHLDIPDSIWSSRLAEFDAAIISTGYWYFRPSLYHVDNKVIGANPYARLNISTVEILPALRIALENMLRLMTIEFHGVTILRTVTVDHFEHGSWINGGKCNRTRPFNSDPEPGAAPALPYMIKQINRVQVEEFERAVALAANPSKLRILNVTYSAYLRPDGHPGRYRLARPNEARNDCLHWCLPGPIDMWNQLVLYTLRQAFQR